MNGASMRQQCLTGLCGANGSADAIKQGGVQLHLQLRNPFAYCRLCQMKRFGGGGKRPGFRH